MPLPAGDDHCRALRPRPANCSPAMMIAFGSDSSFSMHSFTIRRAARFVDATRGMTAIDSIVVRRSPMLRVLMDMVDVRESGVGDRSRCLELRLPPPDSRLLILQQLLDPLPQF